MGDEKALLVPRDADKMRGAGPASLSSDGVKANVKNICRINTGSQTHISFPEKELLVLAQQKGTSARLE